VIAGKPAGYKNNYRQQLSDLYTQIMNRPQFSYAAGSDPMYLAYRDQYVNLGRQAMLDATAQAAALTGGYGNSYAATAGNQAYQAYLRQLNEVAPELYRMAYERYEKEGAALSDRYAMTAELEGRDYDRYKDELADWQAERDAANSDYWNRYNADYGRYADMLDYYSGLAAQENAQFNADREYEYNQAWNEKELSYKQAAAERDMAYDQAMAVLKTGKLPTSGLLEKAQITKSDAKKLAAYYSKKSASSSSGRSSSGSSSKSKTTSSASKSSVSSKAAGSVSLAESLKTLDEAVKKAGTNAAKATSGGGAGKALNMTR